MYLQFEKNFERTVSLVYFILGKILTNFAKRNQSNTPEKNEKKSLKVNKNSHKFTSSDSGIDVIRNHRNSLFESLNLEGEKMNVSCERNIKVKKRRKSSILPKSDNNFKEIEKNLLHEKISLSGSRSSKKMMELLPKFLSASEKRLDSKRSSSSEEEDLLKVNYEDGIKLKNQLIDLQKDNLKLERRLFRLDCVNENIQTKIQSNKKLIETSISLSIDHYKSQDKKFLLFISFVSVTVLFAIFMQSIILSLVF